MAWRLVWVVDADTQSVTLHDSAGTRTVPADGVLDGGAALPGFQCRVAELFE